MKVIQVLGPGCPKCKKLAENAESAINELGIDCRVEKITDINAIASAGVLMTPGLVIDGELKSSGKLLSPKEIAAML